MPALASSYVPTPASTPTPSIRLSVLPLPDDVYSVTDADAVAFPSPALLLTTLPAAPPAMLAEATLTAPTPASTPPLCMSLPLPLPDVYSASVAAASCPLLLLLLLLTTLPAAPPVILALPRMYAPAPASTPKLCMSL